jgi:hypothetical protein
MPTARLGHVEFFPKPGSTECRPQKTPPPVTPSTADLGVVAPEVSTHNLTRLCRTHFQPAQAQFRSHGTTGRKSLPHATKSLLRPALPQELRRETIPRLMAGFFMRGRIAGMKQFSIRDLLFLVVIVALALGWWLDHSKLSALCHQQETELGVFRTPQTR